MTESTEVQKQPLDCRTRNDLRKVGNRFLKEISFSYKTIKDQYSGCMTLQKIIEGNETIKLHLGQMAGYDYGIIDSSSSMIDMGLTNIKRIVDGDLDFLPVKSLAVSMDNWNQLARLVMEQMIDRVEDLNDLESQAFQYVGESDLPSDIARLH